MECLEAALNESKIMLAVIGNDWLRLLQEHQKQGKTDFVRIEIQTALDCKIPLIPVLLERATMPEEKHLPIELRKLSYCQAIKLRSGKDLQMDLQRLVSAVERRVAKTIDLWDVFICHAAKDKSTVADPLYEHLNSVGIRCSYDRGEILWGESITAKINEGLQRSRFFIIVVSAALFHDTWTPQEINIALSRNRILALKVESTELQRLTDKLNIKSDKRYIRWTGNVAEIEDALRALIDQDARSKAGLYTYR